MAYKVFLLKSPGELLSWDCEEGKKYLSLRNGKNKEEVLRGLVRGDYHLVVKNLGAGDLEEVFDICNSFDAYWPNKVLAKYPEARFPNGLDKSRSLSVGDLVADDSGKLWHCAPVGWQEIL